MSYDSDDSIGVDVTPERPRGLVIETSPLLDNGLVPTPSHYLNPGKQGNATTGGIFVIHNYIYSLFLLEYSPEYFVVLFRCGCKIVLRRIMYIFPEIFMTVPKRNHQQRGLGNQIYS